MKHATLCWILLLLATLFLGPLFVQKDELGKRHAPVSTLATQMRILDAPAPKNLPQKQP